MPDKKIAVVTGANRGIGKEIAKELLENGVKVILTSRDPVKGKRVLDEFLCRVWTSCFTCWM